MEASPFNRLSAELRNRIYEYALELDDTVEIGEPSDGPLYEGSAISAKDVQNRLALTLTCKQVRREALSLFFWVNRFLCHTQILTNWELESRDQDKINAVEFLQKFFDTIGGYAQHIQDLTILIEEWSLYIEEDDYLIDWLPQCVEDLRSTIPGKKTRLCVQIAVASNSWLADQSALCLNMTPPSMTQWRKQLETALADLAAMMESAMRPSRLRPTPPESAREDRERAERLLPQFIEALGKKLEVH